MHAVDAIHGDLGNGDKADDHHLFQKGETPEIKALLPVVKPWEPWNGANQTESR